jgi:hypothetical protein
MHEHNNLEEQIIFPILLQAELIKEIEAREEKKRQKEKEEEEKKKQIEEQEALCEQKIEDFLQQVILIAENFIKILSLSNYNDLIKLQGVQAAG